MKTREKAHDHEQEENKSFPLHTREKKKSDLSTELSAAGDFE